MHQLGSEHKMKSFVFEVWVRKSQSWRDVCVSKMKGIIDHFTIHPIWGNYGIRMNSRVGIYLDGVSLPLLAGTGHTGQSLAA